MELLVPLRLLASPEELRFLRGEDGRRLDGIARACGVRLDAADSGAVPAAFGGAVLTVNGTMWQKRTAGRQIVDLLFEHQGVDPQRWATGSARLTAVLPAAAYAAVASAETAKSVRDIGAGMRLDAPAAGAGAPARFLAHFTGNAQQAVSAATRVNNALQDLADHGRLVVGDFAEGEGGPAPLSVAEAVRSARLAPAAGVATQPPHEHPGLAPIMPIARAPAPGAAALGAAAPWAAAPGAAAPAPAPAAPGALAGAHGAAPACEAAGAPPEPRAAPGAPAEGAASRLPLLLPRRLLDGWLLPQGHLRDIAQRCGVHIDVAPGDPCELTLSGSAVANAIATLHLQWRAAQAAA